MVLVSRAAPPMAGDPPERTLLGIAMALAAMALFSCMDGLSKDLAVRYHPIEIGCLRYLFATLFLVPFILRAPLLSWRTSVPFLQLWRGLAMVGSAILFISGLSQLPIADATAIAFASPLLVTALSIPMLGEKVGFRRWAAVAAGFLGVVIVVRPGTGAFNPAAAFPLLSAAFWAIGLILTRRMRSADSLLTTMLYSTVVGFAACAVFLPFVWSLPATLDWPIFVALGALNAVGQSLLVLAFMKAPASLLAPFSYSQMLWSTLIGYFAFATIPDGVTWIGVAVIIASGLYTLHRERIVAQRSRRLRP